MFTQLQTYKPEVHAEPPPSASTPVSTSTPAYTAALRRRLRRRLQFLRAKATIKYILIYKKFYRPIIVWT